VRARRWSNPRAPSPSPIPTGLKGEPPQPSRNGNPTSTRRTFGSSPPLESFASIDASASVAYLSLVDHSLIPGTIAVLARNSAPQSFTRTAAWTAPFKVASHRMGNLRAGLLRSFHPGVELYVLRIPRGLPLDVLFISSTTPRRGVPPE